MQLSSIDTRVLETYNDEQLEAALHMFLQLYKDVRYSLSPRFELELAVSRLITLKQMMSSSRLVKHIQDLKLSLTDNIAVPTIKKEKAFVEIKKEKPIQENTVVEVPKKSPDVEEIVEKAPPREEKEVTVQIIREMSQLLAEQRDAVGMLLHQVVDIDYKKDHLIIMFSSIYVVNQAKEHTNRLKEIFFQHCGFSGTLSYELEKKEEEKIKEVGDEVMQDIVSMFRGEIINI
jgi:DNA polymerase-3 subunit gamma/tau